MKTTYTQKRIIRNGILLAGILGFVSMGMADPDDPYCVPDWGDWGLDEEPTLTATCPAVADQCVNVAKVGDEGGPVGASVTATPTDGTKIRYDDNDCEDPNDETGTCSLGTISYSWTASGCGANPPSGSGASASFKVNAAGSVSVTFTATASDCFGNSYSASSSVSFNVQLNVTTACTPPTAQPANPFGLPDSSYKDDTGPYANGWGIIDDHYITGTLTSVQGNEQYKKNGAVAFSGCGASLVKSFTGSTWSWSGTFSYGGFQLKVEEKGDQVSSQVFNQSATSNTRWYGQVYDQRVTPISGILNGNDRLTRLVNGNQSVYNTAIVNQSTTLQQDDFLNSQVGTVCSVPCCPSL